MRMVCDSTYLIDDTFSNFELPWNPAKKNQWIGRINRFGQKSMKLTIFNFITRNSIEQLIASGLLVKQNLFYGVQEASSKTNFVDFPTKGRSLFIEQPEEFICETEKALNPEPVNVPAGVENPSSSIDKTDTDHSDFLDEPEDILLLAEPVKTKDGGDESQRMKKALKSNR
jgi:hypothetical protein